MLTQLKKYFSLIKKSKKKHHIKELLSDKKRNKNLILRINNSLECDFSRQRVDNKTLKLLLELAEKRNAKEKFVSMQNGEKVNLSENRAALHTALRSFNKKSKKNEKNNNAFQEIKIEREKIKEFTKKIHTGALKGTTGKKFCDVVVVGIGGSSVGTIFVSKALSAYAKKGINLYFLSNIDNLHFDNILKKITLEKSLFIIISKSNSTMETLLNEKKVENVLKQNSLKENDHIVSISSKEKINKKKKRLATFNMFDFVGGRFSVSSAVGALPLSLLISYENFEKFLKGAEKIDKYLLNAKNSENPALISALIDIWNTKILDYKSKAILPYPYALKSFVPHLTQLVMESLGKGFDADGIKLKNASGYVIFGDSGINAQHSFMQMAHQGLSFPVDFISTKKNFTDDKNIYNKMEANMLAQADTLAIGNGKDFEGNRPSSIIRIENISPESIGSLLAFYEAQVVYYAFILNINPFDQPGVELAKQNAKNKIK